MFTGIINYQDIVEVLLPCFHTVISVAKLIANNIFEKCAHVVVVCIQQIGYVYWFAR